MKEINNKKFEDIKHIDENGVEFWYARELMICLNYSKWSNFKKVISKAIKSCENSDISIFDHFADVGKMVQIGSEAQREQQDYKLTRYACYLIAQNGDSRKKVIALAQTYFAVQTRKQEITEKEYCMLTLVKYHKPYRQAFKAYNKKMYLSSVMILIALFEGICAEYIFEKKSNTNTKNCVNQYLNKKYTDRTKFLTCQNKEAMKSFIDNVFYTGINFENEDSIKVFNRQPIMYGRFLDQIGKRENLQMLNAIDNLVFLIKI